MLHITFYGIGVWGGRGGGVIIVAKRTHPILLGSFWSRPETNPFRTSFLLLLRSLFRVLCWSSGVSVSNGTSGGW